MVNKKILYLIIFSCPIFCLFSFSSQTRFSLKMKTLTMLDGLLSNNISQFYAGPNGMMWIATWNGLCNYDGYRFNSFKAPMDKQRILTTNRLRHVVVDDNNDVWLTTVDKHLYLLSSKENKYIDYCKTIGLDNFYADDIKRLTNGAIWILGTDGRNIRVNKGQYDITPTNFVHPDICRKVVLTADSNEWLMGNTSTRRYGCNRSIPIKIKEAFRTQQGILLIGDKIGIYDVNTDKFSTWTIQKGMGRIVDSKQLSNGTICVISAGSLWVLKKNNVFYKFCTIEADDIYKDWKDRLWAFTSDDNVKIMNVKQKSVKKLKCTMPVNWPRLNITHNLVHEDKDHNVWFFIPQRTIYYFDESDEQLVPMDLRDINGITDTNMVFSSIGTDQQRNVWINNMYSTYILSFCNKNFRYIPFTSNEEVRSVITDYHNRYWAATKNGHIGIFDSDGIFLGYLKPNGEITSQAVLFSKNPIYTLFEDSHHRIWIGTRGDGLYLLKEEATALYQKPTQGSLTFHVQRFTKKENHTSSDDYLDINEDIVGRIWFATGNGTLMYYGKDEKFVNANNGNPLTLIDNGNRRIRQISNAADGTVILSTNNGLLTFNPRFHKIESIKITSPKYSTDYNLSLLTRDVSTTLCCHKQDNVYVATMGGGIQRIMADSFSNDTLHFQSLSRDFSNLNIGSVRGMMEDSQGMVWIVGEHTISSYNAHNGQSHIYTSEHWGQSIAFTEAKPCYNKTNNIMALGTLGGILLFKPSEIKERNYYPSIVFSGVLYQGEEFVRPLFGNQEVKLPVDRHNAMVFFSAIDYSNQSQIRYAYRIKELSDQWVSLGTEHYASLSNMPPGHYTLEVRSTNSDGTWVDNNADLRLYVVPTFWQTTWAYILYLIMGGLLLYGIIYIIQLRNAHHLEKKLKEQQLQFFTDISHQLRTPLTLIGGPVEEVLNTEKLSEKATTYLQYVKRNANKMLTLVNKSLNLEGLQEFNKDINNSSLSISSVTSHTSSSIISSTSNAFSILVVEDNNELRYFLTTTLATHYHILEAENGKVGLELAIKEQPNFIITDIMMPEMDGISMIRRIKQDKCICHIPIIILSARTADVYRIEGLKEGADDYITKPFSMSYLQARVESIVRQRQFLQDQLRKSLTPTMEQATTTSQEDTLIASSIGELTTLDQHFTKSFRNFIIKNYTDKDLSNEDIANALKISRSVLYAKVKSIYGTTPNEIIKNLRISQAHKMIKENFNLNISEIAYTVGFNDSKYFSKLFKQTYGITPNEFRKSLQIE